MVDLDAPVKALVVSANPFDGMLGCGGTIKRLIDRGSKVKVVIFSMEGSVATLGTRPSSTINATEASLEVLGCHDLEVLDRDWTEGQHVLRLLDLLCHYGPKEVFIPSFFERTTGSQRAAMATMRAVEMYPGRLMINSYEVLAPIDPNSLVNITESVGHKFESITKNAWTDDIWAVAEKIVGLNAYRSLAATDGSRFCEAFVRGGPEVIEEEARKAGLIS
jgi:LmbE family N-acetylglucosaminyl deacetylase